MTNNDVLLISEEYIKSVTNISDNIANDYLLPSIKLAQDLELEETIGTHLLQHIQALVYDNRISDEDNAMYKLLIDKYIQPYLAYATIQHLAPTVAYKIANQGVIRTDDEKSYNITSNEVDKVTEHYKHLSNVYKKRLQLFLIANYNEFPELMKWKSIADIKANLYSAAGCNVNLGGARGKYIYDPSMFMGYGLPSSIIDL